MRYISLLILLLTIQAQGQKIIPLGDMSRGSTDSFTYVVIGDYGDDSQGELATADMVRGWSPLFIITTGDNDYEDKNGKDIETNISKYYAAYINSDLKQNRFFPCLGNHDQSVTAKAKVIDEYFKLFAGLKHAENYDFTWGPLHFYSINSGPKGTTGNIETPVLDELKTKLAAAPEPFHLVFFHHPQYSSAYGSGGTPWLSGGRADVILNGHIHYYERMRDTLEQVEYITIGCSGRDDSKCGDKLTGDREIALSGCFDHQNGALRVTVVRLRTPGQKGQWRMTFDYYNTASPQSPTDTWMLVK
jgi:hypothetical protein